jgi:excisionase family DNA binding protein
MTIKEECVDQRRYLSVQQAARYLGICVRTLHKLVADGSIRAAKIGQRRRLVDRLDLDGYVESRKTKAAAK